MCCGCALCAAADKNATTPVQLDGVIEDSCIATLVVQSVARSRCALRVWYCLSMLVSRLSCRCKRCVLCAVTLLSPCLVLVTVWYCLSMLVSRLSCRCKRCVLCAVTLLSACLVLVTVWYCLSMLVSRLSCRCKRCVLAVVCLFGLGHCRLCLVFVSSWQQRFTWMGQTLIVAECSHRWKDSDILCSLPWRSCFGSVFLPTY
jgi:hypothetical protein